MSRSCSNFSKFLVLSLSFPDILWRTLCAALATESIDSVIPKKAKHSSYGSAKKLGIPWYIWYLSHQNSWEGSLWMFTPTKYIQILSNSGIKVVGNPRKRQTSRLLLCVFPWWVLGGSFYSMWLEHMWNILIVLCHLVTSGVILQDTSITWTNLIKFGYRVSQKQGNQGMPPIASFDVRVCVWT